jgi:hypothetical protein
MVTNPGFYESTRHPVDYPNITTSIQPVCCVCRGYVLISDVGNIISHDTPAYGATLNV